MYFPIIDVLKENFIEKIPSIVTQWLTDNVNPVGSAVVVDASLSISGAAADAKVAGDEISDLKSDLNDVFENHVTGELESSGNTWKSCRFFVGHTYKIKNTSTANSVIVAHTTNGNNYDYVETINATALNKGNSIDFTPTIEATTIHVYANGQASFDVIDLTSIYQNYQKINNLQESYNTDMSAINTFDNAVVGFDNLLNGVEWNDGYSINAQGVISPNGTFRYSEPISVTAGIHCLIFDALLANINTRIHGYNEGDEWVEQIAVYNNASVTGRCEFPFTVDDGIDHIRISIGYSLYATPLALINGKNSVKQSIENLVKITDNAITDYDKIVRSVNRVAYGIPYPQQSIVGYKYAYRLGFRNLLCDIRFTSDNVPVCFHDEYFNQNYNMVYTDNHALVPQNPPIYIANLTYADTQTYDVGYYMGSQFSGTRIMSFEDMLKLCKCLGVNVYLELKVSPTSEQYGILFRLIRDYGMEQKTVWAPQTIEQLASLTAYEPNVYLQFHSNTSGHYDAMPDSYITAIINATNDYNRNRVTITLPSTVSITEEQVSRLSSAGVGICSGTVESESYIDNYLARGKQYYSIIESLSHTILVGKYLFNKTI